MEAKLQQILFSIMFITLSVYKWCLEKKIERRMECVFGFVSVGFVTAFNLSAIRKIYDFSERSKKRRNSFFRRSKKPHRIFRTSQRKFLVSLSLKCKHLISAGNKSW